MARPRATVPFVIAVAAGALDPGAPAGAGRIAPDLSPRGPCVPLFMTTPVILLGRNRQRCGGNAGPISQPVSVAMVPARAVAGTANAGTGRSVPAYVRIGRTGRRR